MATKMKADVRRSITHESTYYFRNNQHTIHDIQIEVIDHVDTQMNKTRAEKELQTKEAHWVNTLSITTTTSPADTAKRT